MASVSEDVLREVIETLAKMDRVPCSSDEREAAEWIAGRFRAAGCDDVALEEEPSWGTFPPTIVGIGVVGAWGALKVALGRRRGALLSIAATAALLDEIQNGPRVVRRAVRSRKTTTNVVASIGSPESDRTLVVLAHHDAAQTGKVFDQTWAKQLHRIAPDLLAKPKNQIPQWWIGIAPGVLSTLGAVTGIKRFRRWGLALNLIALAAIVDILRSPTVPGANDNLSGVATLVGLAESLRAAPVDGVRVVLASCGAEETLQDGIRAFMARHRGEFKPGSTWFLNPDTVGSTDLVMLEGEGPAWMEDYNDPSFRDLVARCATESGVGLTRGIRARASTDSVIPSRAGFPTATLVSLMPWRMPGNYHLMTDVPENVDYSTVADTVRLARSVAEALAAR
jgi:hypothetical protein